MLLKSIKQTTLISSLLITQLAHALPLELDEDIVFFPTSAHQRADGLCDIPVHAWIFESEKDSFKQKFGIRLLGEILESVGISDEQTKSQLFRDRLAWFLVDNKRNKTLKVLIDKQPYALSRSKPNGHSYTTITSFCNTVNADEGNVAENSWTSFNVQMSLNEKRQYSGEVQFIPQSGLSVISDIDDTIKVSNVLDKKALIKNTFAEPFMATQGMPKFYQDLKKKGAYFHYVSASPWQLYPSLKGFMKMHYPKGSISLRPFRVKDSSLLEFLKSSRGYKLKRIREIIQRYPGHQFILVGDNGEHDPEVYASIVTEFPNNIHSVYIRDVLGSLSEKNQIEKTLNTHKAKSTNSTSQVTWKVFKSPEELR